MNREDHRLGCMRRTSDDKRRSIDVAVTMALILSRLNPVAKRVRSAAFLAAHPYAHWRYTQNLRKLLQPFGWMWKFDATPYPLQLKYLRNYLTTELSTTDRRHAIHSHYEFFHTFRRATAKPFHDDEIWQHISCDREISIALGQASTSALEGELTLSFLLDRIKLYELTFAVVCGSCFDVEAGPLLFIGGVQGAPNSREAIRAASKANGEISPLDMLLIACRALADVLNIKKIAGSL